MQKKILTVLVITAILALSIIVLRESYYRGYYQGVHDGSPIILNQGVSTNTVSVSDCSIVEQEEEIIEEIIEMEKIYDEEDLRYLSSIIQSEAGNQCEAGQQAVGIVVLNRVNHETYFADTIKDVIYEKGQFGPASNGRLSKALKMYDAGTLPEDAINAAKYVLDGNTSVFYKGENIEMSSYLYFNTTVKNPKKQIQDHYFK